MEIVRPGRIGDLGMAQQNKIQSIFKWTTFNFILMRYYATTDCVTIDTISLTPNDFRIESPMQELIKQPSDRHAFRDIPKYFRKILPKVFRRNGYCSGVCSLINVIIQFRGDMRSQIGTVVSLVRLPSALKA